MPALNSATAVDGTLMVGLMGFVTPEPRSDRPALADVGLSLAVTPNLSTDNHTQRTRDNQNNCANPTTSSTLENGTTEGWSLLSDTFATDDSGLSITQWQMNQGSDSLAAQEISLSKTEGSQATPVNVQMVLFHKPR